MYKLVLTYVATGCVTTDGEESQTVMRLCYVGNGTVGVKSENVIATIVIYVVSPDKKVTRHDQFAIPTKLVRNIEIRGPPRIGRLVTSCQRDRVCRDTLHTSVSFLFAQEVTNGNS